LHGQPAIQELILRIGGARFIGMRPCKIKGVPPTPASSPVGITVVSTGVSSARSNAKYMIGDCATLALATEIPVGMIAKIYGCRRIGALRSIKSEEAPPLRCVINPKIVEASSPSGEW